MALIRRDENVWDPFRELREMSDRMNRAFGLEPWARRGDGNGGSQALTGVDFAPQVNISETEKAYLIKADLPGVRKEDVQVKCENGMLSIEGERKQEKVEDNERFHRVESTYGRFMRRFVLPDDADESGIDASFQDGALTVRVPRAEQKQPKARQIKVH